MAQWQTRELDQDTAHAVALMTLWIGATDTDDTRAAELLTELLAEAGGAVRTVDGLRTLCGTLLVLLELDTGVGPATVLQRVGAMVAAARNGTPAPG